MSNERTSASTLQYADSENPTPTAAFRKRQHAATCLAGLAESGDPREQLELAIPGRVRDAIRHVTVAHKFGEQQRPERL